MTALERLHAGLKEAGVRLVASLPDDWLVPLLDRINRDPEITHVPVAREVETVGVCAGAWFGGVRAAAIMGMAGVLTCGHEFTTLNLAHQIPMFILASRRGGMDDPRTYQVGQGLVGIPYLDALQIPHVEAETEGDLSALPAAYTRSLLVKRPFAYVVAKHLLLPPGVGGA